MKKTSIGFAVILALVFVTAVSAFGQGYGRGFGPGYGRGFGPGYCWGLGLAGVSAPGITRRNRLRKLLSFKRTTSPSSTGCSS